MRSLHLITLALPLVGCVRSSTMPADDHTTHPAPAVASTPAPQPSAAGLPAGATDVATRLAASTRHAEWAMVRVGNDDSVRAWVVYPERRTNAPVVIVVHEIFGLSTWIRGVADQLAQGDQKVGAAIDKDRDLAAVVTKLQGNLAHDPIPGRRAAGADGRRRSRGDTTRWQAHCRRVTCLRWWTADNSTESDG